MTTRSWPSGASKTDSQTRPMPIFTRSCGSIPNERARGNAWVTRKWCVLDQAATLPRPPRSKASGRKRPTTAGGQCWSGCGAALQSKKDRSRRAEAEKALLRVNDRCAVPMVWATFGQGDVSLQPLAVQVLDQIDDPSAARSLAAMAVVGGSADVSPERDRDLAPARSRGSLPAC